MGIADTGFDQFARITLGGLDFLEKTYSKMLPDAYIRQRTSEVFYLVISEVPKQLRDRL